MGTPRRRVHHRLEGASSFILSFERAGIRDEHQTAIAKLPGPRQPLTTAMAGCANAVQVAGAQPRAPPPSAHVLDAPRASIHGSIR